VSHHNGFNREVWNLLDAEDRFRLRFFSHSNARAARGAILAIPTKVVTVCIVLAAMILVSQAQMKMRDSDKARVTSLENAWNEAEKHKDAKAVDGLLAPFFAYTESDGTLMNKQESFSPTSRQPATIPNRSRMTQ
jgi:hypothetical protein